MGASKASKAIAWQVLAAIDLAGRMLSGRELAAALGISHAAALAARRSLPELLGISTGISTFISSEISTGGVVSARETKRDKGEGQGEISSEISTGPVEISAEISSGGSAQGEISRKISSEISTAGPVSALETKRDKGGGAGEISTGISSEISTDPGEISPPSYSPPLPSPVPSSSSSSVQTGEAGPEEEEEGTLRSGAPDPIPDQDPDARRGGGIEELLARVLPPGLAREFAPGLRAGGWTEEGVATLLELATAPEKICPSRWLEKVLRRDAWCRDLYRRCHSRPGKGRNRASTERSLPWAEDETGKGIAARRAVLEDQEETRRLEDRALRAKVVATLKTLGLRAADCPPGEAVADGLVGPEAWTLLAGMRGIRALLEDEAAAAEAGAAGVSWISIDRALPRLVAYLRRSHA
jgi:hypothetical protein